MMKIVQYITLPLLLIPALVQAEVSDSALFDISGTQVAEVQKAADLIAGGADVNARDAAGNTPLMIASAHVARNGYADEVWRELLICKPATMRGLMQLSFVRMRGAHLMQMLRKS